MKVDDSPTLPEILFWGTILAILLGSAPCLFWDRPTYNPQPVECRP